MNKKILIISSLSILSVIVLAGFFVPLGSYTTTKGCSIDPTPTINLHLIVGDSIDKVKANDTTPLPDTGCSMNTKYVLHLF